MSLSFDGLSLYFTSDRARGFGSRDLYTVSFWRGPPGLYLWLGGLMYNRAQSEWFLT